MSCRKHVESDCCLDHPALVMVSGRKLSISEAVKELTISYGTTLQREEILRKSLGEAADIFSNAASAFAKFDSRHGDMLALSRIYRAEASGEKPRAEDMERTRALRAKPPLKEES